MQNEISTWKRISFILLTILIAFFVGFTDESIQMFSGRGPAIFDVWIDFAGFATASVIFYTVASLVALIRKKANKKT